MVDTLEATRRRTNKVKAEIDQAVEARMINELYSNALQQVSNAMFRDAPSYALAIAEAERKVAYYDKKIKKLTEEAEMLACAKKALAAPQDEGVKAF